MQRKELESNFQKTQTIDTNKLNSKEPILVETEVNEMTNPFDVVSLRIRTESGKQTIMIKLLKSDTIDKVYELVEAFSETGDIEKFQIRSNFPKRVYKYADASEQKTLQELGLAPSCALILTSTLV